MKHLRELIRVNEDGKTEFERLFPQYKIIRFGETDSSDDLLGFSKGYTFVYKDSISIEHHISILPKSTELYSHVPPEEVSKFNACIHEFISANELHSDCNRKQSIVGFAFQLNVLDKLTEEGYDLRH